MNNLMSFKFRESGRVYLQIYFLPYIEFGDTRLPNTSVSMQNNWFKVDTGADTTTISKKSLLDFGYSMEWIQEHFVPDKFTTSTATGQKVNAGVIQLPKINILGYEAESWPFKILLEEGKDFHNLLGRDLLAGFDYTFKNSTETFEIQRISVFKPIYSFLPNQKIHESENVAK